MVHQHHTLLLGAHMSTAGGLEQAIIRGESIGCSVIQIFTKSNRQWAARAITKDEASLFKNRLKTSAIKSVIAHASYLINIGSAYDEIAKKSRLAILDELDRCELLNIAYLVLHPGSHGDTSQTACLDRIAQNLDLVLNDFPGSTKILLENMAGQGSSVCFTFEQLATIRESMYHKDRVGICFDTCHAFAAGYDFRAVKTYEKLWTDFDSIIGLEHLKAMHINDSKKGCGSRVDRHADVGMGELGLEPFDLLFNDPRFFDIPKVLETPYESLDDYVRNLKTIKSVISTKTRQELNIEKAIE